MTPATTTTVPFSIAGGTAAEQIQGNVSYSVSGLDDTKTYAIALFRAEDVTVSSTGLVTFKDANVNNVADWTETSAVIKSVNNVALGTADTNGINLANAPVSGVLKFTIDSLEPDEVIPVVFLDADGGSSDTTPLVDLDLDSTNGPSELFAIGGQTNWTAPEAATTGTPADGVVGTINKVTNSFGLDLAGTAVANYDAAAVDQTYFYDSNDIFAVAGAPATLAEFEAALSRSDFVVANVYAQDDTLVSNFNISAKALTQIMEVNTSVKTRVEDALRDTLTALGSK